MLRKFKVSNFKSFDKEFMFDLTNINGYEFNKDSIKNEIVNNAIIYGHNGVGKSNLALAIFDIIEHLTDKERNENAYGNYLNANSKFKIVNFYYEFFINNKIVTYEYRKSDYKTILYERLTIDGNEVIVYDRNKVLEATILLKGAETLRVFIDNNELSILKYVKNNSFLEENETNLTFKSFFLFIEGMLYFRILEDRTYLGLMVGGRNILEDIIENGNLKDFESFLNKAGVECKLKAIKEFTKDSIAFNINGVIYPFDEVASTGTHALVLFYFWFQKIKNSSQVSFLFIDEFDAFYHHSLSALIVEKLKSTGVQFILTTHNTTIISNDLLRPDCYFLMNKQKIVSLSNSTPKELREAHNIEKMYKAGSFNVQ